MSKQEKIPVISEKKALKKLNKKKEKYKEMEAKPKETDTPAFGLATPSAELKVKIRNQEKSSEVLKQALAFIPTDVLVIGVSENNEFFFMNTSGNIADAFFMMEVAKRNALNYENN